MPLPKISSDSTITIPARQEKVYDAAFMTNFTIVSPPTGPWKANIRFHNYNYDLNEVSPGPSTIQPLVINDLLAEAGRSTLMAQVLGGVVTAVGLLLQERKALADLAAANTALEAANLLEEGAEKTAAIDAANTAISVAQTALNTVRQNLGVV